ncbi:MAG TPA: hypothetical protein PKA41_10210 [Verrucomicrobiota bacterium]|nr:hypothetical protein [Verrucomicrobiota bacterium]
MNEHKAQAAGIKPSGAINKKRPGLKVEIEGASFSQATQSEPLPYVWGAHQRAGTYILPPFGIRAVAVKTKAGK